MSVVPSYKQGIPCWVDLSTPDLAASKEFYGALFGWEFVDMPIGNGLTYTMAKLKDQWIAGLMQQTPEMAGTPTFWGVFFSSDDVKATAAKVEGSGGQVLFPVDEVPNDSGWMFVAADPSGAVVGFWEAKNHHGTGLVNEVGTVVWNELTSDDVAKVLPFYKNVAGLDSVTSPMGDLGEYTRFLVDGQEVAGAMAAQPGMPNAWSVYFAVEDCDAGADLIKSLGGSVLADPFDIPFGRMAVAADPTGGVFCFMHLAQPENPEN